MTTTVELRNRLDAIESQKIILTSSRDDIAFAALVDRNPKAIAEASELNAKIARDSLHTHTGRCDPPHGASAG